MNRGLTQHLNSFNMMVILFILSIAVFFYLLYVLIKPEKF